MTEVGNLIKSSKELEWRIPRFSSLSKAADVYYNSSLFSFAGQSWYFSIYPNGYTGNDSTGYIDIYLYCASSDDMKFEYSISFKMFKGQRFKTIHCSFGCGAARSISRSELTARRSDLLHSDVLTILCTLKYPSCIGNKSDFAIENCPHCKDIVDAKDFSFHQKKCVNRPIKCPECFSVVALKYWYDHICQVARAKDFFFLEDYKKVLLNGKNHDLILKIGDIELKAHRDILMARSHVFESMLNHDMTEKNSGIINIPDCDPQAMKLFLVYVYCGKVETLNASNMLGLYYIADKYDMKDLKEECCDFIKMSLSTTNICEVIELAMKHSDFNLLDYATEYFMDNTLDIMLTVEWQTFLKDNSTLGNELLIKSFKKVKNIKN